MPAEDTAAIQYITPFSADCNFLAQTHSILLILEHLMFGHSPKANVMNVKHDVFHNS